MTKYKQKDIKALVADGAAVSITKYASHEHEQLLAQDRPECIGYSIGTYGINGLLLRSRNSGNLYAITKRSTAIFLYL